MTEERFRQTFLVVLVVAITVAFVAMIRGFLLTILLAAIFAGLARPLYLRIFSVFGNRRVPAAFATLALLLLLIGAPVFLMLSVVTREAIAVSRDVAAWAQNSLDGPSLIDAAVERIPYLEVIAPYRDVILMRLGELVGNLGTIIGNALSAATTGTVLLVFHFFILLYSMFFFLIDGPRLLQSMMEHLPLAAEDKARMLDKFTSVTRATLKGTVLIGGLQGGLAGLAFWVAGIEGAIFWTALMIVLAIIPGIGAALVWAPAVVVLLVQGQIWQGLALAAFCALVVGAVDNVLRPMLVGRDTKMHDLLILFSTLGGLVLFGVSGFIVGPILAALFITVWDIFGTTFRDVLPDRPIPPNEPSAP